MLSKLPVSTYCVPSAKMFPYKILRADHKTYAQKGVFFEKLYQDLFGVARLLHY